MAYLTIGGSPVTFTAGTGIVPCSTPLGTQPVIVYGASGQALTQPGSADVVPRPPLPAFNPVAPVVGGETFEISTQGYVGLTFMVQNPPGFAVSYNGQSLPLSSVVVASGWFYVTVPPGVQSGSLDVSLCSASASLPFTVLPPTISSAPGEITTTSGGSRTVTAGQSITIDGANFAYTGSGGNAVLLNGSPLTDITYWSDSSITAVLPASLGTGIYPLAVKTGGGTSNVVDIAILAASGAVEAATHIAPPTSSANPSYVGEPVTYTAAVTSASGVPTGNVTFEEGGAPIPGCATQALTALGVATCDPTYATPGARQITAVYGGAAGFLGASSQPLSESVVAAPTTTAVSSIPAGSAYGQPVILTATVGASSGTPTGTVTFASGSATLGSATLVNGTASLTTAALPPGNDTVTGTYAGSTAYAGSAGSTTVTVAEPAPGAVSATAYLPAGQVGAPYTGSVVAAGGTPPYSWSVTSGTLPAGLNLSPTTGVIGGTPTAAGTTAFTVRVTDSNGQTATAAGSISVDPLSVDPLSVATQNLPAGQVGSAYAGNLAASGGVGPYTWAVTGGSLPAGFGLSVAGAVYGTPTAAGTSSFEAQVTDGEAPAQTATANLSIRISQTQSPILPVSVVTTVLPTGQVGMPYGATLAASGGTAPYAWSVLRGTLPAGLGITVGGAIHGTPTAAGTSSFEVQVTDSEAPAHTATANLSVDIALAPVSATGGSGSGAGTNTGSTGSGSAGSGSGTAGGGSGTVTGIVYQTRTVYVGFPVFLPATPAPRALRFHYDPAVFFPPIATGMSPLRLGIYARTSGVWSYVGGEVNTAADLVQVLNGSTAEYPAGTEFEILPVTTRFSDVPAIAHAAWYTRDLDISLGHHVILGFPGGTFRPASPVTRAQFAAMLVRALRLQPAAHAPTFSDVSRGAWYYRVVEAASSAGIIRGFPDGTFQPNAAIQRDQAVAMIVRAVRYTEDHTGPWVAPGAAAGKAPAFVDQTAIPAWAVPDLQRAHRRGLVLGFPDGTFRPVADLSRAQAVAVAARLIRTLQM